MTASALRRRTASAIDQRHTQHLLTELYGPPYSVREDSERQSRLRISTSDTATFGVHRLTLTGEVVYAEARPRNTLFVSRLLAGRITVRNAHHDNQLADEGLVLLDTAAPSAIEADSAKVEVTRLSLRRLEMVAASITELPSNGVRFYGGAASSTRAARHWNSTVRYVRHSVLADEELAATPLVEGQAFQALASAALYAFPNSVLNKTQPATKHSGFEPATVRRAVAFMDAHVLDEIYLADIARAARLTPRGLQAAFRRYRDQSPVEYLRSARLHGAHHDLGNGDSTRGTTVASISSKWGFSNPGRFSNVYRSTFGTYPRTTLDS